MACWSRSALLWLLASACGLVLLGYCVYFDRKRRNATDFKQRLRESKPRGRESGRPCGLFPGLGRRQRRKEQKKAKEYKAELRKLKESEQIQEFFLQEIQLGELWLTKGEQKKSVEHLINAISVCAQPNQLMQVLEQTLPPRVFEMLVHSIPHTIQVGKFETFKTLMNAVESFSKLLLLKSRTAFYIHGS
ncbi:TOMM20-like protein 1 isoform X2 [Thamnophis elegans]|uniref:TOMM20-like protein 1 isoform X2 n=1 Tax=Thamnophis elegans TaxID=35005 RepID=UPI0013786834|nr:TOMM20-like protein 1 isoform X2 [Thamnophis elegans]